MTFDNAERLSLVALQQHLEDDNTSMSIERSFHVCTKLQSKVPTQSKDINQLSYFLTDLRIYARITSFLCVLLWNPM